MQQLATRVATHSVVSAAMTSTMLQSFAGQRRCPRHTTARFHSMSASPPQNATMLKQLRQNQERIEPPAETASVIEDEDDEQTPEARVPQTIATEPIRLQR